MSRRIRCPQDLPATPWKSILTSWPVWALIVVEAGHDWGGFTIITDLPKYMSDVLHFSITEVSREKENAAPAITAAAAAACT